MDQIKEIQDLKRRVAELEAIVKPAPTENLVTSNDVPSIIPIKEKSEKSKKHFEEFLGKYLIAGIASIFLMIAVLVIATSVWGLLSEFVKFAGILLVGLAITIVGYLQYKKHPHILWSILFGTGLCVVFIDIIAGVLAFQVITDVIAVSAIVLWSTVILLIQRSLKIFYTTAIVCIGTAITILYMFSVCTSYEASIVTMIISILLILSIAVSSYYTENPQHRFTSFVLSWTLAATVVMLYLVSLNVDFKNTFMWSSTFILLIACLIAIWKMNYKAGYFFTETSIFFTTILFVFFFEVYNYKVFSIVFILGLLVAARALSYRCLSLFFATAIVCWITQSSGFFIFGAGAVSLVLTTSPYLKGNKLLTPFCLITFIELLSSLLVSSWQFSRLDVWQVIVYSLSLVYIIIAALILIYRAQDSSTLLRFYHVKIICLWISVLACFLILMPLNSVADIVVVTVCTGLFLAIVLLPSFNIDGTPPMFYTIAVSLLSLILYISCYNSISGNLVKVYEYILLVSSCSMLIAFNYISSLTKYHKLYEFLVITKTIFLIFYVTTSMMSWRVSDMRVSIVLLIVSLCIVSFGFWRRANLYRFYGLVMIFVSTAKIILVDLNQSDSITRAIALVVGSIICFCVSLIYHKLGKMIM